MKKFTLILFITLVSFLSFSQKNVNLFATDFHSFSMTVDELTYFMNTDTTLNKWSYVESYDSDFFMLFDINLDTKNFVSSIDQGDTLDIYPISYLYPKNKKTLDFVVNDSNNTTHNFSLYKVNDSYRFIQYHMEGNFAVGYVSKKVSLE
jgi:hypothetical protein